MKTVRPITDEQLNLAAKLATEIAARVDSEHGRTEDWLNENFRRQIVDRHARDVLAEFWTGRWPP
jgi:DNA-binding GntR family transcriptional regulator